MCASNVCRSQHVSDRYSWLLGSFLISIYEKSSLASAIVNHFETLTEEAPVTAVRRAIPSQESVKCTLQACDDQTTAYRWHWRMHLLSVGAALGLQEKDVSESIPETVFQGLTMMLPLAQSLPEDRFILVETQSGACTIVVWAHILLGLRVAVRSYNTKENGFIETQFPRDSVSEQVILYMGVTHDSWVNENLDNLGVLKPSIVLFTTSDRLVELKEESGAREIDANLRRPLKGIGRVYLERLTSNQIGRERVMDEMAIIACSFALCIARKFVKRHYTHETAGAYEISESNPERIFLTARQESVDTPALRIFNASCMVFGVDDRTLSSKTCEEYASLYHNEPLYKIANPPSSVRAIFDEWTQLANVPTPSLHWELFRVRAVSLAMLILALAHVHDLEACADMPMSYMISMLSRSELREQLSNWNGRDEISVSRIFWFDIIALLMAGERGEKLDLRATCLLSEGGWSLYLSTFGDSDPSYIGTFLFSVRYLSA